LLRRLLVVSGWSRWAAAGVAWWLSRSIKRDRAVVELQHSVDRQTRRPAPAGVAHPGRTTPTLQHLGEAVNSLLLRLQESLSAQPNLPAMSRTSCARAGRIRAGELRIAQD